jgi:FAD dependent monooxygenase
MDKRSFKVIVVGGSIAGLTLAHSLDLAGIDYIVLEKHSDPLATVGGSVGLLPNGWRILHQLGLRHQLEQEACPVKVAHMTYPDGFVFSDNFPAAIQERQVPEIQFPIGYMPANDERFGYSLSVLTRQQLIEVLYLGLRDKSKIKVGQRVIKIQHHQNRRGVSVFTESGQEHVGDLVAGADGVHSITRSQMWLQLGQKLDAEKERRRRWNRYPHRVLLLIPRPEPELVAEYSCVFGISSPLKGIPPGEQLIACHDNATVLAFPGKDAHIGWGLIQKLNRPCNSPATTQSSDGETALIMAKSAAGLGLCKDLKFHDLWVNTPKYSFTILEEGLFQIWHHGRIVCLGDSVSKVGYPLRFSLSFSSPVILGLVPRH